ncbi:MAG: N-acetylneuraminate synthase family protein [Planctomycetia bacterium]|nr:N-acetylneuraminate synthase family protein [Planctomycetia bacterium]
MINPLWNWFPTPSNRPRNGALVVAEIGQNHNGSRRLAEQLVDAAVWAGADAVKLVKRDLDSELSRDARERPYQSRHAYGRTYGEHRAALELTIDDHAALAERARRHGLLCIGTGCDLASVDAYCRIGVDGLKIASRDVDNLPLVDHIAARGLPVFMSTGMSPLEEIDAAAEVLNARRARWAVLHCTSLYPTPLEDVHLRSIQTLADRYQVPVGFSDHSPGILIAPLAVAFGALVIEKHLTLDRAAQGSDHACSLEPDELRELIGNLRASETALGDASKPVPQAVTPIRARLGRSLVARVAIPAGTRIEAEMLTLKCPGDGIHWTERHAVVGHHARGDIAVDDLLTLDDVSTEAPKTKVLPKARM